MRDPLVLNHRRFGLTDEAACAVQTLYLLGLVGEEHLQEVMGIVSDRRMIDSVLSYGAYVHSITPIHPRLIQGRGGRKHLAHALQQLQVPEHSVSAGANLLLEDLQQTMRDRLELAKTYRGQYRHDCRVGTVIDLRQAVAEERIIGVQHTDGYRRLALILPGDDASECRLYDPTSGWTMPTTFEWMDFYAERMYSIYGTTPR